MVEKPVLRSTSCMLALVNLRRPNTRVLCDPANVGGSTIRARRARTVATGTRGSTFTVPIARFIKSFIFHLEIASTNK